MASSETIQLIVIDDSSNYAESIASTLKNKGYAVRTEKAEDDEDLRNLAIKGNWDMILAKPEIPFFTATDALSTLQQIKSPLPLLIIADDCSQEKIQELLDAGARDAVYTSHKSHMVHVVLREVECARLSKRYHECQILLDEANNRAQALVDSSRDAVTYIHDGMHIYSNESYLQMFGYSDPAELEGMPVMNLIAGSQQAQFKEFLRKYTTGKTGNELEVCAQHADGKELNIKMEFSSASYDGEPCIQIIIRDQSASKELEQKLKDMSKLDLVTGVYNRQFFFEVLGSLVGKKGFKGAVFFVEPDNFTSIKENLGISGTDAFLADFAGVLKKTLQKGKNFVARLENKTFTVVMQGVNEEQSVELGKRLLHLIEEHIFETDGNTLTVTASMGVGVYSEATTSAQQVIDRAEKAFGESDGAGGNTVSVYTPDASEMGDSEQVAMWTKKIKQALKEGNFRLLYQPIVSLTGDEAENYEVLLRMLDEQKQEIMPNEFFPAADKAGLAAALDRWVIAHAVKAMATRQRTGINCNLFVKITGATLKDRTLLPWLRDLAKAAKLKPKSLVLEVSEDVANSNLKAIKVLIDGLKQLHIRFALDNFGTAINYANLLKHCDADLLKLSREVITTLAAEKESQDKVKEITVVAKKLNKQTVANGVEDARTLSTIYSTGVDYIQGYFLQEPHHEMDYDFSNM